ncbi:hypothetical protein HT102_01345 [Hoyosella sp. G463]|uniref:DoxX family membrane protein n=1 Tax=Lolliginicoccus lacisalsi TaxID=2742202 RepID=A0A927J9Q8_9ACTN|nr:hypothetical protein [Lolliginicoccus lacisalsi]MBD8505135.1 hypothetical protein [Lolliginicoccus lacisalsi]
MTAEPSNAVPSPRGRAAALRLAVLLAGAGVVHFVAPQFFDRIVPRFLPGEPRLYTQASGVAELGIAGLLAVPRSQRIGATLAALLFVAVFPANVQMTVDWLRSSRLSPWMKAGAIARLPLQVPLVTEALKARA